MRWQATDVVVLCRRESMRHEVLDPIVAWRHHGDGGVARTDHVGRDCGHAMQHRLQRRFRRQRRASQHQLLEARQLGAGVVGGRGGIVRWTGCLGHA